MRDLIERLAHLGEARQDHGSDEVQSIARLAETRSQDEIEIMAKNAGIIRMLKDLVGKRTTDAAYGAADELVRLKLVIAPRPGVISWSTSPSGSGYRITKKGKALLKYWRDNKKPPSWGI